MEVLVAIVFVLICLVPAMEALQATVRGPAAREAYLVDHLAIQSKMEEVLTDQFSNLLAAGSIAGTYTNPTSYSDTITTTDNRAITRNVYIAPVVGTSNKLLQIKVAISDTGYGLETYTSK